MIYYPPRTEPLSTLEERELLKTTHNSFPEASEKAFDAIYDLAHQLYSIAPEKPLWVIVDELLDGFKDAIVLAPESE